MSIYTFHLRRPDGTPGSFEAYDLDSDSAAAVQAAVLLEQHMSAGQVEVYNQDRRVLTRSRASAAANRVNAAARAW